MSTADDLPTGSGPDGGAVTGPPVVRAPVTGNGVWSPGRRLLTVGLLLLVTLVASEALAVATVLPRVEHELGDIWLYGWVLSGFFLGNLVGVVVAGRAADRMRPIVPFALGLTLFVAGLLVAGSANSMLVLVAARIGQGIGAGALPTVAYACIGREYPQSAQPRMFALLSTAWVVPSVVGPVAAGYVGEHWSWRWVFLGLVPVVVACGAVTLGAMARIPASEAPPQGANLRDALVVAAGTGLALLGLYQSNILVIVPVTAVGIAIGLPAFRRLTPPGTLHARPGLPAAISVRGLLTLSFFMADAYVPLMLTTVRKGGTGVTVVALTASSCLWTAGSWVQERRIATWGPRRLVRVGFVFIAIGIGLLAVTLLPSVPPAFGILAWAIGGLGIGMAYSPLSVTTLAEAGAGREGRASSSLQLSDVLGVTLGTGLGGAILATGVTHGWSGSSTLWMVFAVAGAVSLCGGALSVRLPRRLSSHSADEVAALERAEAARPAMPRETSSQFPHS